MKNFVRFMVSKSGRALRIVVGLALIVLGAFFSSGINWVLISIAILPLATGLFDICVFSPLLGYSLSGQKTRIMLGLLLLAGINSQAQTCPGSFVTPPINITSLPYHVTGLTTCGTGNSINHTTGALLCDVNYMYYGEDKTFIFTPTVTDSFAIILKADIPHTTMTLYKGCPFNGGTCVAFVGDGNSSNPPWKGMLLQLTAGTTYYLLIDNTGVGNVLCIPSYDLSIETSPSNDDIGGAVTLTPGNPCSPVTGNTYAASRTLPVPNECGGSVDDDVWYKFTATSTNHTITATPIAPTANIDLLLDIRDGGYGGTNIACSYLGDTYGVAEVIELTNLTVGHTYYVRVYTNNNTVEYRGYFNICVTTPAAPAPPNNECAGAVYLTAGDAPVTGTTAGATQSLPAVSCNGTGNADDDVWYAFTTNASSFVVTASSAALDLVIDVRQPAGNCSGTNLTCINNTGAGGTESATVTTVNGVLTYFFRVYSAGATTGTFTISVSLPTAPPACLGAPSTPTNGQSGICPSSAVSLSWPSQSGATSYDVYFGTSATPPLVGNVAGTSYSTASLATGTYYWQIRPKNAGGAASGCTVWSFTVSDNTLPLIACPANVAATLNAACQGVLATYTPTSVSDNCGTPTVTQTPAAGATVGSGTTTVTLRATDAANNSASCTFTVTLSDLTAPTITCPANVTVASTGGSCQASLAAYAPVSVNDNCTASPTVVQLPAAGTTINSGATTVTLRATDASSNSGTCTFTVTIVDQTLPTITCPANTTVTSGASCQTTLAAYAPVSVNDNCGTPTVLQIPAAGTPIATGATTVTLRATDDAGNSASCTFTVTASDQTLPTITCPANTTVAANASCQASLAAYTPASVNDNCGTPTVLQIPAAGTALSGGATTVTLRATDGSGNSANCTFSVTVVDQTVPTITCPANTTVAAAAACQVALNNYAAAATATDNCTAAPTKTQSPVAGTTVGIGSTTVTLRATDAANNSANCTFTVTVSDQTPPTITCPANTTVAANAACGGAIGAYSAISVSDNCAASPTVAQSPAAGTTLNGSNDVKTVTLTANDGNGNTTSCTFTVTLKDLTPPTITCPANQTVSTGAACSGVVGAWSPASLSDNCGPTPTLAQVPTSGATLTGHNDSKTVVLTATDGNGNTAACSFTVTLKDGTAPIAKCKNATINLGINGTLIVSPSTVDNLSTDNCSFGLTLMPSTFSCANLGANTVTLKATDAGGNTSTCTAIVTLRDMSAPTALCKNITVYLDESGHAGITAAAVNNNSYDACGIATMTINNNSFDCSNISSAVPVQLILKDVNNNQSTCLAYVTVKDNLPPTPTCNDITVSLGSNGYVVVQPADLTEGSFDNCSVWSFSPTAKVYTSANLGVNNLTISVKDYSNNAATCVAHVTVKPYGSGLHLQQPEHGDLQAVPVNPKAANGTEVLDLSVAPNPTTDASTLTFRLVEAQHYRLRVFDLNGRLVMDLGLQGDAGDNSVLLEMGALTPGVYLIDVQSAELHGRQKLVLQH